MDTQPEEYDGMFTFLEANFRAPAGGSLLQRAAAEAPRVFVAMTEGLWERAFAPQTDRGAHQRWLET